MKLLQGLFFVVLLAVIAFVVKQRLPSEGGETVPDALKKAQSDPDFQEELSKYLDNVEMTQRFAKYDIKSVAATGYASIGLTESGQVVIGGLGNNKVHGEDVLRGGIKEVSAGSYHLLMRDGKDALFALDLGCEEHSLGGGGPEKAVLEDVALFCAGFALNFALTKNGELFTWGTERVPLPVRVALPVEAGEVQQLSCGSHHALLLAKTGAVYSFGANHFGQLGRSSPNSTSRQWGLVPSLPGIAQVSCGGDHSLALSTNGTVFAWGWAEKGQIGSGSQAVAQKSVEAPQEVAFFRARNITVSRVAGGGYGHSLAISSQGMLYGWGWAEYYQLGRIRDNAKIEAAPRKIETLGFKINHVAEGSFKHSLVQTESGKVYGFGDNFYHQVKQVEEK